MVKCCRQDYEKIFHYSYSELLVNIITIPDQTTPSLCLKYILVEMHTLFADLRMVDQNSSLQVSQSINAKHN